MISPSPDDLPRYKCDHRKYQQARTSGSTQTGSSSRASGNHWHPTIVLFELRFGIAKSARPKENSEVLSAFLALDVVPWPFDAEDAQEAAHIRAELERHGASIGPYDVLIAAGHVAGMRYWLWRIRTNSCGCLTDVEDWPAA
jgi:predicted nucleic acid-binding protein